MKRRVIAATVVAPLAVLLATCGTPAEESPDLVLHNGKIVTRRTTGESVPRETVTGWDR